MIAITGATAEVVSAAGYHDLAALRATTSSRLPPPCAHNGGTYRMTGPEALSLDEIAAHLSVVAGRPATTLGEVLKNHPESYKHLRA
jgi:uncharacterized protein YbjT (DUF2867 family)